MDSVPTRSQRQQMLSHPWLQRCRGQTGAPLVRGPTRLPGMAMARRARRRERLIVS